ncbi:hypothetical protein [Kineosporia sp. A_224]|uniref:hypothetical protein n=1 Tax=Kineosporia sp. A_224 TaxID=1962180 RepID=UPI000B4BBF3E|nr:hypothetical protein [Kineosporia sp. A_224]
MTRHHHSEAPLTPAELLAEAARRQVTLDARPGDPGLEAALRADIAAFKSAALNSGPMILPTAEEIRAEAREWRQRAVESTDPVVIAGYRNRANTAEALADRIMELDPAGLRDVARRLREEAALLPLSARQGKLRQAVGLEREADRIDRQGAKAAAVDSPPPARAPEHLTKAISAEIVKATGGLIAEARADQADAARRLDRIEDVLRRAGL